MRSIEPTQCGQIPIDTDYIPFSTLPYLLMRVQCKCEKIPLDLIVTFATAVFAHYCSFIICFLNIMSEGSSKKRISVSRRHALNHKHLNRITTIYLASSYALDIVSRGQRINTLMSHNLKRGHAKNLIIHL